MNFQGLVDALKDPGLTRPDADGVEQFVPIDLQSPVMVRESQTGKLWSVVNIEIEDHGPDGSVGHTIWIVVDEY